MNGCSKCTRTPDILRKTGALVRGGLVVCAGFAASLSLAAVPVVESRSSDQAPGIAAGNPVPSQSSQQRPSEGAPAASPEGSRLTTLYYQIQLMQEELRQLRGQVEEQQFLIDRLRRDQREQYLDLDGRVSALTSGAAASVSTPAAASAPSSSPTPNSTPQTGPEPLAQVTTGRTASAQPVNRPAASRPASSSASAAEQQSYNAAIALMRDKRFDDSVDAFNQLVVDYPNGALTPNAFYWLGELYLAKDELEQSRQSFTQVMNLYPDHRKVPDAIYKLGVVFSLLGDSRRSLELLKRVQTDYPGSSAAGLADSYAAELQ